MNGSLSSVGSLYGSASTLSSRRPVPSGLSTTSGSQLLNNVDDDMDSLSSGTTTPMTTPTTTDSEFNMEDDSSVFNSTMSSATSGFVSSESIHIGLLFIVM